MTEKIVVFDFKERTAITFNGCIVELWERTNIRSYPEESRIFSSKDGKAILTSDKGQWWESSKIEAPYCYYALFWFCSVYSPAWAWGVRYCKTSQEVSIVEIPPKLPELIQSQPSESNLWVSQCLEYVPLAPI